MDQQRGNIVETMRSVEADLAKLRGVAASIATLTKLIDNLPRWTAKPKRKRKPTLARALREAAKAGINVAGATIEDGKVSLTFGGAQPEQTNDLDK